MRRALYLFALCAATAQAQQAGDDVPLPDAPAAARVGEEPAYAPWNVAFELAGTRTTWRDDTFAGAPPARAQLRASVVLRYDSAPGSPWRFHFSDRLDDNWRRHQQPLAADRLAHTLQEAYVGYAGENRFLDLGRFNEKSGVAYGYSPNDVFRRYAVVARNSDDPAALRNQRLGTVGLRAQQLFDGASLTAVLSPSLRTRPTDAAVSPHLERSNSDDQAYARLGWRLPGDTQLDVLAHYRSAAGLQAGANLSTLVGNYVTAYGEVAGSPERDLRERALAVDPLRPYAAPHGHQRARLRYSVGFNVTPSPHWSAGLEWQGDATALDADGMRRLLHPANGRELGDTVRVLTYAAEAQDLVARRYQLAHLGWSDMFGTRFALAAFARRNAYDGSRFDWMQIVHPQGSGAVALAITRAQGGAGTEFGYLQSHWSAQCSIDWNF